MTPPPQTPKNNKNNWKSRHAQLIQYKADHGDVNVPRDFDKYNLGQWVHRIRHLHRTGRLKFSDDQVQELNELGFVWVIAPGVEAENRWVGQMEELVAFKDENGHVNVPSDYQASPKLAKFVNWCRRQRRLMQKGKSNVGLTKERIAELDGIGFVWQQPSGNKKGANLCDNWDSRCVQLRAYYDKHNDVNVPHHYKLDGLGQWVHRVRLQQKKGILPLNEEQVTFLNELGFVWEVDNWKNKMDYLRLYKDKHGDVNVPQFYADNPALAKFVQRCRRQHMLLKKGKPSILTTERVYELDSLGFVWTLPRKSGLANWDDMILKLQNFKAEHGDVNIDKKDHPQLFKWLQRQRRQYKLKQVGKLSILSEERVAALMELGVVLESNTEGKAMTPWDRMYEELQAYHDKHGHSNIPRDYAANRPLAHWTARMKQQLKLAQQGKVTRLSDERVAKLKSLDLLTNSSKMTELRWAHRVAEFKCYVEEHGNGSVPKRYSENPGMAAWVMSQRRNRWLMAKGKPSHLTPEKIAELDQLSFDWGFEGDGTSKKAAKEWEFYFDHLEKYKQEHGMSSTPPWDYKPCEGLASWVVKQSKQFHMRVNGKPSRMSDEQYDKLMKLGFAEIVPDAINKKGRKHTKGKKKRDLLVVQNNDVDGEDDFMIVEKAEEQGNKGDEEGGAKLMEETDHIMLE